MSSDTSSGYECQRIFGYSWDQDFEDYEDMDRTEDGGQDGDREDDDTHQADNESHEGVDDEDQVSGLNRTSSEEKNGEKDSGDDGDNDDDDQHHEDDDSRGKEEEDAENDDKSDEGDHFENEDHNSPDIAVQTLEFMMAPENAMVEGDYDVPGMPRETLDEALQDRFLSGEDTSPDVA